MKHYEIFDYVRQEIIDINDSRIIQQKIFIVYEHVGDTEDFFALGDISLRCRSSTSFLRATRIQCFLSLCAYLKLICTSGLFTETVK